MTSTRTVPSAKAGRIQPMWIPAPYATWTPGRRFPSTVTDRYVQRALGTDYWNSTTRLESRIGCPPTGA
ncbi:MAG: hypothetical protein AAEJ65_05235, partial [Planctomycetota bacterium]